MTNSKPKRITEAIITPAFRLSYPALYEPQVGLDGDPKRAKYSITMLFPKTALAKQLKANKHPAAPFISEDNCKGLWLIVEKILRANFGPDAKAEDFKITKFRDGDKPRATTGKLDESAAGMIWTRATTGIKAPPKNLRQDKTVITEQDQGELYPGCWCRASITVAPFYLPERGVTYFLSGVQKLADDVPFSNRPRVEDVFDTVAQEEGAATTASEEASPSWMD